MSDNIFKKMIDVLNTPIPGTAKKKPAKASTGAVKGPVKPAAKGEAKAIDVQRDLIKRDDQLAKAAARADAQANAELRRQLAEQRAELNRTRRQYEQEMAKQAEVHAKTEEWTHTVVPGDTLSAIAKRYLGNAARWPEIQKANADKISNPNLIYPGQVFVIPRK